MDYTPPPDLEAQYAFVIKVKSHFYWKGVWGEFAPTFSRGDLSLLEEQSEPRGEECMRQLKETGVCVFNNLRAKNGDKVTVSLDRGCAVSKREGAINGSAIFPVPEKISKLLPTPANPVAPLDCSKPGIIHFEAKPTVALQEIFPAANLQQIFYESAGRRIAFAPALPVVLNIRKYGFT